MTESQPDPTLPLLHCLDGKQTPEELPAGIEHLERMTEAGRAQFDELVQAVLPLLPDDQIDNRIGRLCRRHELPLEATALALKATRFLLHHAARVALEPSQLENDVRALGGETTACRLILAADERHRHELRQQIAQASVAAHGKVLTGIEWRIDTLGSSNRGRQLNLPIAMLTLHHLEGDKLDRTTVQLLPDSVAELYEICKLLLDK